MPGMRWAGVWNGLRVWGLWLCMVVAAQGAPLRVWTGVVVHVSDGDTLWVRLQRANLPYKLRLDGLDAPEICQAWGPQAKEALRALVLRHAVTVQVRARDTYGRWLARVYLYNQDVGAWLVLHGHAWSYGFRGEVGPYAVQQALAQHQRQGLFAQGDAVAPRAFRRRWGPCPHPGD